MKKLFCFLLWLSVTLLFLSISNYFLNKQAYEHGYTIAEIIIGNLALCSLLFICIGILKSWQNKWFFTTSFLLMFLVVFISASELLIFKYSGVAFVDQSFLHFELDSLLIGFKIYPIKYLMVIFSLVIFVYGLLLSTPILKPSKRYLIIFLVSFTLFLLSVYGTSIGRLVVNYSKYNAAQSIMIKSANDILPYEVFGIQPVISKEFLKVNQQSPQQNLIVIYLESFSRFFVNSELHPEITPEIGKLIETHGELRNYRSTAKFTMQGLLSSYCGTIPNLAYGNNIGKDQLPFEDLTCLPDILKKAGYYQEFIGGARKSFANKEDLLLARGFDQVYGWLDYNKPKNYQTNDWGLQDSDLLNFTVERIKTLSQQNQPFHVSVLTLATHLDGNPDPSCPRYLKGDIQHKFLDGVHCTDYLVGKFIQQLEQLNVLENTTVVLTSDHGVFPVDLIKNLFGKNIDRNELFGLIIGDYQFDKSLPLALYDLPALLLESLKIQTNTGFVNGRSPETLNHDRFILRENILSDFDDGLSSSCNEEDMIDFPVDPCENRRLLELTWGHLAKFNDSESSIELSNILLTTHQEKPDSLLELFINDKPQSAEFLKEGYQLKVGQRLSKGHLFILLYDLKTNKILSRNALELKQAHLDYFDRYWMIKGHEDLLVMMFIEQPQLATAMEEWQALFKKHDIQKHLDSNNQFKTIFFRNSESTSTMNWELDTLLNIE